MKSKEKIPRRFFLAGTFLIAGSLFYWQFGLLPGDLKNIAIEHLERLTHKQVRFDRVIALPFYGVRFDNLKIAETNGSPILVCDRLRLNAKIIPFLQEKKIVIDQVEIDSPVYEWRLHETRVAETPPMTKISGQIPIPVAPETQGVTLERLESGPDILLPENVYLQQIWIRNGLVTIRDHAASPVLETLQSIHVKVNFERPPALAVRGSLKLGQAPYATLGLQGVYDLESSSYEFHSEIKTERIPDWLIQYQSEHLFTIKSGRCAMEVTLKSIDAENALFKTTVDLDNASLSLRHTLFTGRMKLEAKGLFNFTNKIFDRYKGDLILDRIAIQDLSPRIHRLDDISGAIHFEPDLLSAESLTGLYQKIPLEVSGSIRSFQELSLKAQLHSKLKLSSAFDFLSAEQKTWLEHFKIAGDLAVSTSIEGTLNDLGNVKMRHALRLDNASIQSLDGRLDLSGLSSDVLIGPGGTKIENARFISGKMPYGLSMFIPRGSGESGMFQLTSDQLSVSSDATYSKQKISFQKAIVNYYGMHAEVKGSLTDLNAPNLDVRGDIRVNLEKTTAFFHGLDSSLKNLRASGGLNGYLTLTGPLRSPIDWDLKADLEGGPGFIKPGFTFDTLQAQLRMKNRMVHFPFIEARTYAGTLGARLLLDYSKEHPFFDTRISAANLDLTKLTADIAPEKKDVSGVVTLQAAMRGNLKDAKSYRGQGALGISKGRLWKTSLFKKMGELPLVRVEGLEEVTFRELYSNFVIQDERLWTNNLSLASDTVNLFLRGSIGFKQDLDLLMSIQYTNSVFQGADDAGGLAPFMVRQAADFIPQYHVFGTLSDPKNEKLTSSAASTVGKKIGGLLQAVLQ